MSEPRNETPRARATEPVSAPLAEGGQEVAGGDPPEPARSPAADSPSVSAGRKPQPYHDRPAERRREAARLAGWRGKPFPAASAQEPRALDAYARGLERRRIAMANGVWYPGRDPRCVAPLGERRMSRAVVRAVLAAHKAAGVTVPPTSARSSSA